MSYKGTIDPRLVNNPEKYIGDVNNIKYDSLWERSLIIWLSDNEECVKWGRELHVIKYMRPSNISTRPNQVARYYIDFYAEFKSGDRVMIEVKPHHETIMPVLGEGKRMSKSFRQKLDTYHINQAKWAQAKRVGDAHGLRFAVWTEKTLDQIGCRMVKSVRDDLPLNDLKQLSEENRRWRKKPSSATAPKRKRPTRKRRPSSARRKKR